MMDSDLFTLGGRFEGVWLKGMKKPEEDPEVWQTDENKVFREALSRVLDDLQGENVLNAGMQSESTPLKSVLTGEEVGHVHYYLNGWHFHDSLRHYYLERKVLPTAKFAEFIRLHAGLLP